MSNLVFTPIDMGKLPEIIGIGNSVTFIEDIKGLTPRDIGIVLLPANDYGELNLSIPTQGDRVVDVPVTYIKPLNSLSNRLMPNTICLTISGREDEEIYLPLEDNIQNESVEEYDENDELDLIASALALQKKWEGLKWGYYETATVEFGTLEGANFTQTLKCTEFDVVGFASEMVEKVMYDRPFEGSTTRYFMSEFAWECFKGEIYSKDFGYQECPDCGRIICVQNPSNGWMTQFRTVEGDKEICLKCFEELKIGEGVTDEEIKNRHLTGMFYSNAVLEENGFELHKSHYVNSKESEDRVFEEIKELKQSGCIVFIGYDMMAIGGLEGYISLYKKVKPTDKEE